MIFWYLKKAQKNKIVSKGRVVWTTIRIIAALGLDLINDPCCWGSFFQFAGGVWVGKSGTL
jgi:hypothetical protein